MIEIRARVEGDRITLTSTPVVASATVDTVKLVCDFDEHWDGFGKTGLFWTADDTVIAETFINDACFVPHEALAEKQKMRFGVYGSAGTSAAPKRIVTERITYDIVQGAYDESQGSVPVTPSQVAQIMAAIGAIEDALPTDEERAAWDDKYDLPDGGIPKTDLSAAVKASLDSADTAAGQMQPTYNMFDANEVDPGSSFTATVVSEDSVVLQRIRSGSSDVLFRLGSAAECAGKTVTVGIECGSDVAGFDSGARIRWKSEGKSTTNILYLAGTTTYAYASKTLPADLTNDVYIALYMVGGTILTVKKMLVTLEDTHEYVPHRSMVDYVARAKVDALRQQVSEQADALIELAALIGG